MSICNRAAELMKRPNSAAKLAANVVRFRHAMPYLAEAGSEKRRAGDIAAITLVSEVARGSRAGKRTCHLLMTCQTPSS